MVGVELHFSPEVKQGVEDYRMETEGEIRQRLEPEYLRIFEAMGMSSHEARETFDAHFEKAKAASKDKQLANVDAEALAKLAETSPGMRKQFDWKIEEGVTEKDFQWWWNMPDLERQLLLQEDFMQQAGYYEALRQKGVEQAEAMQHVKVAHPDHAEFLSPTQDRTDVHGPLPVELKMRVVQFIERQAANDPTGTAWAEIRSKAGSCNAAIRKEILAGNL